MKGFKLFFILLSFGFFSCGNEPQITSLSFFSNEFMFEPTKTGDSMTTYFKFRVNQDKVSINSTRSDCSCSIIKFNHKKILKKNDIDSIKVIYDSSIKGRFVRRVYVETNVKDDHYTLYIKGQVVDSVLR